MITGFLIIAIVTFVAILSYRRPRLEQKVFKNIPLHDWLIILGFPPIIYIGLVMIVGNILQRPRIEILDYQDFTLIMIGNLFLFLAYAGTSIHFVSKVISRYLPANRHSLEYQVNEIFHGKLSHYMVMVFSLLMLFTIDLFEINHPVNTLIRKNNWLIVFTGIILGISASRMVINSAGWFGGYFRPVFTIVFILIFILFSIFRINTLSLEYYPVTLFSLSTYITIIVMFAMRQIFIFSKLSQKRRLRFLAKLFNS